jgi:hypothetical protein
MREMILHLEKYTDLELNRQQFRPLIVVLVKNNLFSDHQSGVNDV